MLRQTIAQYQLDTLVFGATMARVGDEAKAGQGPGRRLVDLQVLTAPELNKRRNELNLAALGEQAPGLGWRGLWQRRLSRTGCAPRAPLRGHLGNPAEHIAKRGARPAGRISGGPQGKQMRKRTTRSHGTGIE